MAKGDYYFPLYYKRLLASTIGWTDAEFGTYLRLLIHQFDNGSIPSDLNKLARIAPSVKKNWHIVSEKFIPRNDTELYNEVMDDIYKAAQTKKERNHKNGLNGGRPKKASVSEIRFYLLECFNSTERFLKPGITNDTIQNRYNSPKGESGSMPYKYTVLVDMILPIKEGMELENHIIDKYESYMPKMKFGGHKECIVYDLNVLKEIPKKNPVGSFSETQTKGILITNNQEPIINNQRENTDTHGSEIKFPIERCLQIAMMDPKWKKENKPTEIEITEFMTMLTGTGEHEKNPADFKRHFYHWKKKGKVNNPVPTDSKLSVQDLIEQENARKLRELHAQ